jgi:transposase
MKKKSVNTIKNIVRKKYSSEFKEQALARVEQDGIVKAARDLGLSESVLYSWRIKKRQSGKSFEIQKLEQSELNRLKRENTRLQLENAFLKKAAAYFAKEQE